MGLFDGLFGGKTNSNSKKSKDDKVRDMSGGRTFAPKQKQKDPTSNRSNKFGPKKD